MFQITKATKEKVKLMLALTGPSGAGKTYSALQLAYGITGDWNKIAVADTENRSALYYAGSMTGEWLHIDFPPTLPNGYHPHNWIRLIETVEANPKIEVLILDSISHEWAEVGGALDLNYKMGGKFTDWAKVTPIHNSFVSKMRSSRLHIIATMRSKSDYHVELNEKGKAAPQKVGTKSIQRDGMDYEFGIIFDIDIKHFATSTKDRTGLFMTDSRGSFRITPETGKELYNWCREGVESIEDQPIAKERLDKWFEYTLKLNPEADLEGLFFGKTSRSIFEATNRDVDLIKSLVADAVKKSPSSTVYGEAT